MTRDLNKNSSQPIKDMSQGSTWLIAKYMKND